MTDVEQPRSRDAGMTLIEVIVAIGLFAVMSTAVLSVLGSAIHATTDDKSRIEAVNLASRELEIVRDTFASVTRGPDKIVENTVVNENPLPGGVPGDPLVVDGVPYTVKRTARWEQAGSADASLSPCDQGSSSELTVLHVKVEVSWPALGDRPPVTMDTIMTPAKGTYSTLDGFIGLKVIDGSGMPKGGVNVTATSGATAEVGVTATDGCVLFAHLPAGDWTLQASNPGYVNRAGDPTASTVAHLQAGQLWRGAIEYDEAASIVADIQAPSGFDVPADVRALPMTLGNSALQPIGATVVPGTGGTRVIEDLWPYPSGYGLWLDGCEDGNPALGSGAPTVAMTGGAAASVVVLLGAVEIYGTPGTPVTATHDPDRLCTSPTTVELGTIPDAPSPTADPSASATTDPTGGVSAGPSADPSATTSPTATDSPTAADSPTATDSPTAEPSPDGAGALKVGLPYGTWTIAGVVVQVGPGDPVVVVQP